MLKPLNENSTHVLNGKWQEYNKRAILIAEGCYLNNRKHGIWREYYDHDGSLMIEEVYSHGISHGRFTCYHPNGQLLSEGEFNNGSREGIFKVYDENGTNSRSILFVGDQEIEDTLQRKSPEESAT